MRKEVAELEKLLVWVAVRNCTEPIDKIRNMLAMGPALIEKAETDLQKAQADIETSARMAHSQV